MTAVVSPDVSAYQVPVSDAYTRNWLSFRVCFAGTIDAHAAANLAWAVRKRASGQLINFTVYAVYQPGANRSVLAVLDQLGVPTDCVVMIDGEKWNGLPYQVDGDRSADLNDLASRIRARQGGRSDLVWAYGNRGPDLEVWPHKAEWLGWVVASYGGTKPVEPNLVGWQYTDGQPLYDSTDKPSASAPFGRCDHNLIYSTPEADMPLTDADVQKIVDRVKGATIGDETVASALRETHDGVTALKTQVAALAAAVAKLQTGSGGTVDPVALAKAIGTHVGLVAK